MEGNKKSKKVIIILILIIILLLGVGGYFGYQYWKDNQTIGTDWGDTYLEYLQDKISNNEYANAKEGSLEFIQFEENKKPAMILSYENNTDKFMEITIMDENCKTTTKKVQAENGKELDMEFLYSITNEKYNWYEHEKRKNGSELFIQIDETDIKNNTEPTEDKRYEFTKEEMTEQEVEEGETPSISKFNEEFVKPEIDKDNIDIDLNEEINKKELKDKIKDAIEKYTPQDQIVTNEVKENVEKSLKELENLKEKIKQIEEDEKNKETENGILVNGNLLKFGKYEGEFRDKTYTLIVNKDKTYQIELPWNNEVKTGEVRVEQTYDVFEKSSGQYEYEYYDIVCFGDDYWGIVTKDGAIQSQTEIDFHYVGNATETMQNQTQTEVEEQDIDVFKWAKKIEESLEKADEEKRLDELLKQSFNEQFIRYKGKQSSKSVKKLLDSILVSNEIKDNKIKVEMDGISTADATQIGKLRNKVATVRIYEVLFDYDSNGYINKVIIKLK